MRSLRSFAVLVVLCLPWLAFASEAEKGEGGPRMSAETFRGLELRGIGPALMSGRISDIKIHPRDRSTWYVAAGSGNVWKTQNAGITWTPIFDDQSSYSIGCLAIDPNRPNTVWVGTGENVSGRHVGYGDGVYRSLDGGMTWKNMGLRESEHIGTILIDPRDSNVVYVAAQGPLWSPGGERGLYKTTDGGTSWEKILGGGEYTGVNEVVMDPRDPDVLYAATHERFRNVAALINGGPESGIHKSADGGTTWRRLMNGLPGGKDEAFDRKKDKKKKSRKKPKPQDLGKIGLAISPQEPDVIYATIELAHRKGGFYRSEDGGETWDKRNDYLSGGTGPHYYQEIFASPHAFDRVYQMDVWMRVTDDGGRTFRPVGEENKHSDNHALAFVPDDPDYLLAGCDGGVYESFDLGENWRFVANLPLTQFYKVAVDYDEPFYNVYGGTQDNATQGGPSRTDNVQGIRNSDWFLTVFGDGHQPAVDPTNPDIVYSQWQQGNFVRHDRKTGEVLYIQPQPAEDEPWDRFNWDAPILISPHDPARIYVASQRVWRSDDRGDSWRPISGDLSRGRDRLTLPMMGRVPSFDAVWDLWAMSKYATVTSLSESPLRDGLFYAGTDDGLVHVTDDAGETWRKIERVSGVPEEAYVNDIKADLHDENKVYAAFDNHKRGDFAPYLLVSPDRGRTWKSIRGDLPDRHIVWRVVQDHVDPDLLFVGTEFGVFFTVDGGKRWVKLKGGAPNIPFRDLVIQRRENDLVGATFGRSFYILDDYAPLRDVSEETLANEGELFPVRKAWWYIPRRTLGGSEKSYQGASFFAAPNPPFGAVFTYYLRDELETRKEQRREREQTLAAQGEDTPYPGWDEIRKEDLEEDPAILLTVRDAGGDVVRRLTGPVTSGIHRVAWDLRYPSSAPWRPRPEEREEDDNSSGFLAAPGAYTVSLAKRVDGIVTDLGRTQSFEVTPLWKSGTLKGAVPEETTRFLRELSEVLGFAGAAGSTIDETGKRLDAIIEVLMRSTVRGTALDDEARTMRRRVAELHDRLHGNASRGRMSDPGPVSIQRRLGYVSMGNALSTYGPPPAHLESFEIGKDALAELRAELDRIVSVELPALEQKLDAANVPWTPGRTGP